MKPAIDVLVDSGAYSAWRLGQPIDINQYIEFLQANSDWIWNAVALDEIIPGDPELAAQRSRENYLRMRSQGLHPLPVWHVGESIDWLYRMLDDGAEYICISASSIVTRSAVDDWYSQAFSHICNKDGLPIVKVHALGEGRETTLRKFPFYSADSASWIYAAQRTGTVQLENGAKMSCRKDGAGSASSPDINGLDDITQEMLNGILESRGIDKAAFTERGNAAYVVSTYCAALYYMGVQERVSALYPIRHKSSGFFAPKPRHEAAADIPGLRLFLVSGGNSTCFGVLAKAGHKNMLSSYFHIKPPKPSKGRGGSIPSKNSGHYTGIQQFAMNPLAMIQGNAQCKRYYDILTQYVK